MNIHEIIKENIKYYILESLSTLRLKYGNELVDKLKSIDPTKTYKYIDFICKLYNDGISKDKIKQLIDNYNTKLNKNLIPKEYRDINKIKSYNELIDILNNKLKLESNMDIKKQYGDLNSSLAKQLYWKTITTDKGTWNVYIPTTMEQSILILSKDTRWCTLMENKRKNLFYDYIFNKETTLYYFINMNGKTTKIEGNDHLKLMYSCLLFKDNTYKFFNNNNKELSKSEFYNETDIKYYHYKYKIPKDGHYNIYINGRKYIFNIKNGKYNGEYIEYYKNNNIKLKCNYKNGELDGEYIKYYENGNIYIKLNYKNNEKTGKYIKYYENGKKYIEIKYNGIYSTEIEYDKDQDVISIKQFKNGMFNGKWIEYYKNGKKHIEYNYKNNKLNGKTIVYNKNGNINLCKVYKNGNFIKDCDK